MALRTIAAAAIGLAVASCGDAAAGDTVTHGSPEGAVRGFVNAASQPNATGLSVIDWIAPSDARAFRDLVAFSDRDTLVLTFRAAGFGVTGTMAQTTDRATVGIRGDVVVCADGVLPPPASSAVHTCTTITSGAGHTISCVREAGRWYVTFDMGSGGRLGGEVTPPPAAPSPPVQAPDPSAI